MADAHVRSRDAAPGPCVLVVEDSRTLRVLAAKFLKSYGYNVLLAGTAEEALQELERAASVDVLLTDVVMPGASGPQLTTQVMEQHPRLKVVYMSGYNDEAVLQQGVRAGIPFLYKPFTPEVLARTIRDVLTR